MALDIRIQQSAKTYRDVTLAAMSEGDIRDAAEAAGIDGFETTPIVTLIEELVQKRRNDQRAFAYPARQLATKPNPAGSAYPGNPGNDNAALE